ncbi:hypothetical protein TNCV_3272991 [Trichonephila clavipes]|nr:hypothetical protein TNCV_3272991 [Trichonephila clavipes]
MHNIFNRVIPRLMRIQSYSIIISNRFLFFFSFVTEIWAESVPEPDKIGNLIEEIGNLAREINLKVDSDDIEELLDSHIQELTMDELIEMQERDIEDLKSIDPVQSEDRMA